MTNTKKYCLEHNAVALHTDLKCQIHGIEYCVDGNIVYLVERVYIDPFGNTAYKYHRCKVRYYADGTSYIRVYYKHWDGTRYSKNMSLDNFIKIGT